VTLTAVARQTAFALGRQTFFSSGAELRVRRMGVQVAPDKRSPTVTDNEPGDRAIGTHVQLGKMDFYELPMRISG
jgi:hypothetical protein